MLDGLLRSSPGLRSAKEADADVAAKVKAIAFRHHLAAIRLARLGIVERAAVRGAVVAVGVESLADLQTAEWPRAQARLGVQPVAHIGIVGRETNDLDAQIAATGTDAQRRPVRGQPVTFQFDEQQLISARPGSSEGRFQWNAIEDYAEDERLAILYVQRKLFLFVPKRAMDEAEWERLRAIAAERKAKR